MISDTVAQSILDHFLIEWNNETAVVLENEQFSAEDSAADEWIRISLREDLSEQHTLGKIGNRKFLRPSRVLIQVFTKQGEGGTERLNQLSVMARDILEGTNAIDDVDFYVGSIRPLPPEEYWQGVVVDIEFDYTETK